MRSSDAGYSVRSATAADRGAIRHMVRSARINPTDLHWQRFLVAVDSLGSVIGCSQIRQHRNGSRELASVVVRPPWRGQGVARAMIEALLAKHVGPIWLTCASPLTPFYEKFEFREVGHSVGLPFAMAPSSVRFFAWLFNRLARLARSNRYLALMVWQEADP
jgi:amino-acid N-acetyltransferase